MGRFTCKCQKVVTELALDTGTVSPLLKRMEQVDLIKRERSEVDQREVFIHLTEKVKQSNLSLVKHATNWLIFQGYHNPKKKN